MTCIYIFKPLSKNWVMMVCRAALASSIAQKAAVHKSETILRQAVERAEMAKEEVRTAERQAAEKAAHAAAQEGISLSQFEIADKARPHTIHSLLIP